MPAWFEGNVEIECDIRQVKSALDNHGKLYAGVVSLMPGLTSVELVEQDGDSVTIRTNEGLMKRTGIAKQFDADRVIVQFDERYEAGSRVTTTAHFSEVFTASDTGVTYSLVIDDLVAPGFLGYFYRRFGGSKTGTAFLDAYKDHFERRQD